MPIDLRLVAKRLRRNGLLRSLRKEAPVVGDAARGLVRALLPGSPAPVLVPVHHSAVVRREGNGTAMASSGLPAHLGQIVHRRLGQLLSTMEFTDADDPVEALHDLRVASRRLRAFVTLFEPMLDSAIVTRVGKPLRRVTKAAGELRDIDVQTALIRERMSAQTTDAARAALEHLLERVLARRDTVEMDARRRIRKVKKSDLGVGVSAALGEVVARLPASSSETAPVVWGLLEPLVDGVEAHDRVVESDSPPAALHELRIAIKKLRYGLELVAPMLGDDQRELIKRAESLQELLGTHHDLIVISGLMDGERKRLEDHGHKTLPFGLTVLSGELAAEERALAARFGSERAEPGYFRDRIRAALARA